MATGALIFFCCWFYSSCLFLVFNAVHFFFLQHYDSDGGSQDGDEEIPIWIGKDDVRYVSGVSALTTCNDVIAVLIQDELNSKSYASVEGLRQDIDDYIIVEKWREVEAKLAGETKILPLYQAWGALQDEVRFRLKINKNKTLEQIEAKIDKKVSFCIYF